MNIRPIMKLLISAFLGLVFGIALLFVGSAILMRGEDPVAYTSYAGYLSLGTGALLCGVMSAKGQSLPPLLCGLCAGCNYGLMVTLGSLGMSGNIGFSSHAIICLCTVFLSILGSCIWLRKRKRPKRYTIRHTKLRAKR